MELFRAIYPMSHLGESRLRGPEHIYLMEEHFAQTLKE